MKAPSATTGVVDSENLVYQQDGREIRVSLGSPDWYAWLEGARAFSFSSSEGTFSAHKTRAGHQRGGWYWRAYRRQHGRLSSCYLGASEKLTPQRLHEAARQLAAHSQHNAAAPVESTAASYSEAALSRSALPAEDDTPLLSTKLEIPRLPVQHIPRPRLLALLDQGVEHALTLACAPAGSGKTTLLAEWSVATSMPTAWLSLEAADNDLLRFLAYLTAALSRLNERTDRAAPARLHASRSRDTERILTGLVNELSACLTQDVALIVDDIHLLTSAAIHAALLFLLDHLPARLHLVFGTRSEPPLPLARLRARGQLAEIRTGDLRFAPAEVSAFLQEMGLALDHDALASLERQTEGWIAGVQLLALALRGRPDPSAFLHSFPGSHSFLLDYVSEEILTRQSAEVQAFLLHTSILERLCGPLCDAVTGQSGGQDRLAALHRANLFISALDETGQPDTWYRYHPLFAEALRSHLQRREPERMPELYRRASSWYEQQGRVVEACEYALLARDFEHAAALIEQLARTLIGRGEFTLLRRWLDLLPSEIVSEHPRLGMSYVWMFMFERQPERAEALVEHLERQMQDYEQRVEGAEWIELRSELTLLQTMMKPPHNDHERTIELTRQMLYALPDEASELRHIVSLHLSIALAGACWASGDLATVELILAEISLPGPQEEYHFLNMIAMHDLEELYEAQGRLHKMERLHEQVLHVLTSTAERPILLFSLASASYVVLLVQWNRLNEAEGYIQQILALYRQEGMEDFEQIGLMMLANIEHARGNNAEALQLLQSIDPSASQDRADMAAIHARLSLICGWMEMAQNWQQECGLHFDDPLLHFDDPFENPPGAMLAFHYLTLARILIAQGRAHLTGVPLAQALSLLERLRTLAERNGFTGWLIEILTLKALALQAQGETRQALTMLGQALDLAEPEGYVRLFADEGQPMARLLTRVPSYTSASPAYIQTLLSAIQPPLPEQNDPIQTNGQPAPVKLLDPLSAREQEVLSLLAEGASNQQIAAHLVITLNTAKRHVKHILAKLAVSNRTQAVARARELHLL